MILKHTTTSIAFLLGVSTFSLSSTVQAATIFVKADAMGTNAGTSWANAYRSLQRCRSGSARHWRSA